jgi:hypothetical protein
MSANDRFSSPNGCGGSFDDLVSELFVKLFPRAKTMAQKCLRAEPLRFADEEDVALSAFRCLCAGFATGRIDDRRNEHELWPLLRVIIRNKSTDYQRHEQSHKRGRGRIRGESAFGEGHDLGVAGICEVIGDAREPVDMVMCKEEGQRLLRQLDDVVLERIAIWKMEDRTNREIADLLGTCVRTVERKLRLIRKIWGLGVFDGR